MSTNSEVKDNPPTQLMGTNRSEKLTNDLFGLKLLTIHKLLAQYYSVVNQLNGEHPPPDPQIEHSPTHFSIRPSPTVQSSTHNKFEDMI